MATSYEFSSEDSYDNYFGDDDVADPDFVIEHRDKSSRDREFGVKIEAGSNFSGIKANPDIRSRDSSKFRNALVNKVVSRRKRTHQDSSDDEFDLPDDYLISTKKKKKECRSSNVVHKKFKVEQKCFEKSEYCPLAELDGGTHSYTLSNLSQLLLDQYDLNRDKFLAMDYLSALVESDEHKYVLNALPPFITPAMLKYLTLNYGAGSLNSTDMKVHFENFCFGVRKYLETIFAETCSLAK